MARRKRKPITIEGLAALGNGDEIPPFTGAAVTAQGAIVGDLFCGQPLWPSFEFVEQRAGMVGQIDWMKYLNEYWRWRADPASGSNEQRMPVTLPSGQAATSLPGCTVAEIVGGTAQLAALGMNTPQILDAATSILGEWVAHTAERRKTGMMMTLAILAPVAAAFIAPAVTGAAGAVSGATTTMQGAELAALVEAGTVGAEGAFLEAAALSGGAVTFSTSSGALLSATLPSGATVAFDPAVDAFAQMGVDASKTILQEAAPVVSDQLTVDVLDSLPQAEKAVVEQVMTENGSGTLLGKAGEAVQAQLVTMGKSMLASELQQWLSGGGDSGSTAPVSFRAAQDAGLPSRETSGKLGGAALPLLIGAAIGLVGMFLFARSE